MTRSVIWQCPCDGRTHVATLTDDARGHHVHALCGKTTGELRLPDLLRDGEITCPQCRTEETLAAMVKHTAA